MIRCGLSLSMAELTISEAREERLHLATAGWPCAQRDLACPGAASGRGLTAFRADRHGQFTVDLPAGTYTIHVGWGTPDCGPDKLVKVAAGRYSLVELSVP